MRRVYVTVALIAFCLGSVSEAFAASPISQTTASTVCANHGGMTQICHSGICGTGCEWCPTSGKGCTNVFCGTRGCSIVTVNRVLPPVSGRPGDAAPITSGKPLQEK